MATSLTGPPAPESGGPLRAAVVAQDQAAGRHGIGHRAAAAAAAADQGQPDGVVLGGVNVRQDYAREGRGRREAASVFQELAA